MTATRHIEPAEPREAAEWLRSNGVTLAALTLIGIQLLWMGDLLAHSYFRQDDYSYLYRGLDSGFGWKYLMFEDAGHLQPLGMALAWVLARVSIYNWPLTCVVTLLLLAAVCFAMLRTLRTLFGNRPAILVLLAVFLFSPLQLAGISWWSVVINVLPLELALLMAVDAHVRYLRGGRRRNAVAAAGWLLIALAASDKGVVVPLLLFGLTAAFFTPGRLPAAVVTAAVRYWRLWLVYVILMAAWGAVYVTHLSGSTVKPDSASDVLNFVSTFTGSTLLPAALGGPWRWSTIGYDIVSPPAALQQLSWAVAVVVVVAQLRPSSARVAGLGAPGRLDLRRGHRARGSRPAGEHTRQPGGRADAVPDGRDARAGPVHRVGLPAGGAPVDGRAGRDQVPAARRPARRPARPGCLPRRLVLVLSGV